MKTSTIYLFGLLGIFVWLIFVFVVTDNDEQDQYINPDEYNIELINTLLFKKEFSNKGEILQAFNNLDTSIFDTIGISKADINISSEDPIPGRETKTVNFKILSENSVSAYLIFQIFEKEDQIENHLNINSNVLFKDTINDIEVKISQTHKSSMNTQIPFARRTLYFTRYSFKYRNIIAVIFGQSSDNTHIPLMNKFLHIYAGMVQYRSHLLN